MVHRRHHSCSTEQPATPLPEPPDLAPMKILSVLVVDEGVHNNVYPPTATRVDIILSDSRTPSWGTVSKALVLQAPGLWVAATRAVVVVMHCPSVRLITTLEQWEDARDTHLEYINRLTVLRADEGLPLPGIPGAADAHHALARVLNTSRPSQVLHPAIPVSPLDPANPLDIPTTPWQGLGRGRTAESWNSTSTARALSIYPLAIPGPARPFRPALGVRNREASPRRIGRDPGPAKATRLEKTTSWGDWFPWSPQVFADRQMLMSQLSR